VDDAVFDETSALAMLEGDRELLRELLTLFLAAAPMLVQEGRRACARGDAVTLARSAHRLRGNSAQLGGHEVSALALSVELGAKAGDVAGAGEVLDLLAGAVARLCERLTAALAR